jgi:hypothetical protein
MVETADEWVAEAVWAGDFSSGDFDRTDLVFGSGIRLRGDDVVFVSPGSTLDRLCYCRQDDAWLVSNSLPALLAVAGAALREDFDYTAGFRSLCRGLADYDRHLPAVGGEFRIAYFNNLRYRAGRIEECAKPDRTLEFRSFAAYKTYLFSAADSLRENMTSPARRFPVVPLTTISSGYDSCAAAVVAQRAGCQMAVTIRQSTSLWRGSDSGEPVARQLGLCCRTYPRTAREYPLETAVWAVTGRAGILNWTLFDYPQPLCLLFTGCHGDKVWAATDVPLADPFVMPSLAELGFGEFRLIRGTFHCPVPYWGIRRAGDVRRLGQSYEMAPWSVGGPYDRPVARRIVEEAGVARHTFGTLKKNTSHESRLRCPYSADAQQSFARYLREHGRPVLTQLRASLLRRAAHADTLIRRNLPGWLRRRIWRAKNWEAVAHSRLLFQWANHEVKQQYVQALQTSPAQPAEIQEIHSGSSCSR